MPLTYVFIDYENVQPASIATLDREDIRVYIFVGVNQTKLSFDIAATVQKMGARAEYVKCSGTGNNALDFHIAYYIGYLSAKDPAGQFVIVSKDTGFDPLIAHLAGRGVLVTRTKDIASFGAPLPTGTTPAADRVVLLIENLKVRGTSRPRTLKTLTSTIAALFQKTLSAGEIDALIAGLGEQGIITVTGTRVAYNL